MAYKSVERKGFIVALISDGYSMFEELGSECEEAANNFPNSNHPKAEAFSEASSTLQNLSEPDIPDVLSEHDSEVTWHEQVNKDKRKGPSRAVRAANGAAMLTASADAIRSVIEDYESQKANIEENLKQDMPEQVREEAEKLLSEAEQAVTDLTELADQLESDANEAEGVEFPGLYG